jgi:sugar lactone lactonase YvrE
MAHLSHHWEFLVLEMGSTRATGIGTDSSDNVYVTDGGSPETAVQKFTTNGTFITSWGSTGLGADGQFISPGGVGVDSSDNVYVSDFGENNRIQKFDSNGNFLTKWGSTGSGDGQFEEPTSIALDTSGNVYVVERGNSRIQVFAPS